MAFYSIDADCVVTSTTIQGNATAEGYGSLENVVINYDEATENLSPMNWPASNPVPYEFSNSITADLFLNKKGTSDDVNLLRAFQMLGRLGANPFALILKVTVAMGRGSSTDTQAMWYRITKYSEEITKPKAMGRVTFESIAVIDSTISTAYPALIGDYSVAV